MIFPQAFIHTPVAFCSWIFLTFLILWFVAMEIIAMSQIEIYAFVEKIIF